VRPAITAAIGRIAKIVAFAFNGRSAGAARVRGMTVRINQFLVSMSVVTPIEYVLYTAGSGLFIASGMRTIGLA
jgi:hypothetical protein